jgi:hypothetical protein
MKHDFNWVWKLALVVLLAYIVIAKGVGWDQMVWGIKTVVGAWK